MGLQVNPRGWSAPALRNEIQVDKQDQVDKRDRSDPRYVFRRNSFKITSRSILIS